MAPYWLNLALMLGVMVLLWPFSIARKDPSYVDSVWPLGFLFLALTSLAFVGVSAGVSIILPMVAMWSLRLGAHLFRRWRHEGADKRYQALMARARGNVHVFVLVTVFLMQGVLLWLVALPVQHGVMEAGQPINAMSLTGLALFLTGFLFETIGDYQLSRFKADPVNAGQVMDQGLWRYTRHPNYFGDACVFWGIWLVAVSDGTGWWTVVGPLFLTFTLVKWSGAALLEKNLHESRPGYADYVARTPGFVPWWPKKG